jgi:hypothetical protein
MANVIRTLHTTGRVEIGESQYVDQVGLKLDLLCNLWRRISVSQGQHMYLLHSLMVWHSAYAAETDLNKLRVQKKYIYIFRGM